MALKPGDIVEVLRADPDIEATKAIIGRFCVVVSGERDCLPPNPCAGKRFVCLKTIPDEDVRFIESHTDALRLVGKVNEWDA